MRTAILVGSERINGNTEKLCQDVALKMAAKVFTLHNYNILPFNYEYHYINDDFILLINELLTFDKMILATPVYWYAASSRMKTFIDRLSDLLGVEKDLGRQLRGKSFSVIATGTDTLPASCFEESFKLTYAYLGIAYYGLLYCSCEDDIELEKHQTQIHDFIKQQQ